jgi:PAS domain S-box-containing protein
MKKGLKKPGDIRIAIINDDPTQLAVFADILSKASYQVRTYSGCEAALLDMTASGVPDLILTDLYMPEIDGWRLCRLLRSPEYPSFNQIPILVVSATFAGDEPSRISADLGADAFLSSPVDRVRLLETVQTLLQKKSVRHLPSVLIVEDSSSVAVYLKQEFTRRGYPADSAATCEEALVKLDAKDYDIAVLDYHLPDGKGDDLLEAFRADGRQTICIMITADPDPHLALNWMKKGAAAYLRKPFGPEYLVELCHKAMRERALLNVETLLEQRTRKLRESEAAFRIITERLQMALQGADLATWDWHIPDGSVVFNERWATMLGTTLTEISREVESWQDRVHPDDLPAVMAELEAHLRGETPFYETEHRLRHKTGDWIWVLDKGRVFERDRDGNPVRACGTHLDITLRKQQEEIIRNSLHEKEILLGEIHHRVKNNMAVIDSLLQLQIHGTDDERLQSMLREAASRVQTLSKLHGLLYGRDDFTTIDVCAYLREIAALAGKIFDIHQRVSITVTGEPAALSLNQASHVGIIVNELITNAFKYAFPDRRPGKIRLSIMQDPDSRQMVLTVADDGIGAPLQSVAESAGGLGVKLVGLLVEAQLEGTLDIHRDAGTVFTIRFTPDPLPGPISTVADIL